MDGSTTVRGTDEWEHHLGTGVRRLRLRQRHTQDELARAANVSLSAWKNLESDRGSQVRTLILVARALGREDWLKSFAPPEPTVSPMQLLRDQQRVPGLRLRHRRRVALRRPVGRTC